MNKIKLKNIKKIFIKKGFVKVKIFKKSEFKNIIFQASKLIKSKMEEQKILVPKNWKTDDILNKGLIKLDKKNHKKIVEIYNQLPRTTHIYKIISDNRIQKIIQSLLNVGNGSNFFTDNITIRMDPPKVKKYLYGYHKDRISSIPNSSFIQLWSPILNDITQNIGALKIIEGSHVYKGKLVTNDDLQQIKKFNLNKITRAKFSSKLIKSLKNNKEISLSAKLGEFVFFSPDLVHKSGINLTKNKVRYVLNCFYHIIPNKKSKFYILDFKH